MTHRSPPTSLDEVLRDPQRVADRLVASRIIYGLTDIDVRVATPDMVCMWLTLDPWSPMAAAGYPTERVAVTVHRNGTVSAAPVGARNRRWLHRNPSIDLNRFGRLRWTLFADAPEDVKRYAWWLDQELSDPRRLGDLCLWFPDDPRGLRWEWGDGLESYITIVHRHLQAEEYWRRTDRWPAEDAPHGDGDHPIRTPAMQQAARRDAA